MDEIRDAISDLVADAINNDFAIENLPENILCLFPEDMAIAERKRIFNESVVFVFHKGFPGCLFESSFAVSSGQDIKEVILEELREAMDEIDSDSVSWSTEADLRFAMEDIENAREDELRQLGAYVNLPDGMILSVQSKTCAEVMRINNLSCPDFGIIDRDGPK